MLSWWCIQLAFRVQRTSATGKQKVDPFTPTESAPRSCISRHRRLRYPWLHASFLRRTTPVVRYWSDIRNTDNPESRIVQCSNRRFSSRAWSFHHHFQVLQAILRRCLAGPCGSYLSCERSTLPGALEPTRARGRPSECIALSISNGNQRIVERRMHMSDAIADGAANPLLCSCLRSCHRSVAPLVYFLIGLRGPFLVRPFVCVRCPRTGNPRRWRMPR